MKDLRKTTVSVLIALAVCTGLMTLAGILLLPAELGTPERSVQENISGVGYTDWPESCGLLFTDSNNAGAFIFLDFENIVTGVYLFEEDAEGSVDELPYRVDYTFFLPDGFTGRLCDRLGGIEMADEEGNTARYFSASLAQVTQNGTDYEEMLKISRSFFEKFANTGLSSEDFMFIIESADTNLTYSVCYDWIPHVSEMFSNCVFN